jgi:hypothetical protein
MITDSGLLTLDRNFRIHQSVATSDSPNNRPFPETSMKRFFSLLIASMIALAGGVATASAADPVAVYPTDTGICGDSKVLNTISRRFDHQVRNVPHLPQVAISDFYTVREVRHLPQQEDRPIERLYCQGKVALSNGHNRDVWYLIEWPMGFAGIGGNVEFCVSGFDRWNVYGGRCRVLR